MRLNWVAFCLAYVLYQFQYSKLAMLLAALGFLLTAGSGLLGEPNREKDLVGEKKHGVPCAFSLTQGRRPYMEDVYLAQDFHSADPAYSLFGVFDGHSGKRAAEFARDNVPRNLAIQLNQRAPAEALVEAFLATDREFCAKAERERMDDGSTGNVALLQDNELWVANAGDARAVLCHKDQAIAMSEDHKPNREDELRRIREAGGEVMFYGCWRVEGQLAVSRGFGDRNLKKFVTARPEVIRRRLEPNDRFLIIATDGLWDVMSNEEAVMIALSRSHLGNAAMAQALTEQALQMGSMDNVTALIVDLCGDVGTSMAAVV